MKAYYIKFVFDNAELYVKAMVFDKDGFGFIETQDKEKAGVFEIEKCEAFRNAMLKKASTLKIEFEEFIKESDNYERNN